MSTSSRRGFRPRDLIVIILFLFIAGFSLYLFRNDLLQNVNLRNVEPVGTVVTVKNTVQRRILNSVLWGRLSQEAPVYLEDLVRVGNASAATLLIEGNTIELSENTLIRITRSANGESLQISLNEGNVSIRSGRSGTNSGSIVLDLNGSLIQLMSGTVLSAISTRDGVSVQVSEGTALFITSGQRREISPGSTITFDANGNPSFSPSASLSAERGGNDPLGQEGAGLQEATETSPELSEESAGSQEGLAAATPSGSSSQSAQTQQSQSSSQQTQTPQSSSQQTQTSQQSQSSQQSQTPQQSSSQSLLPAPRNMQPVNGYQFGMSELQSLRNIEFSWQAVQGANAYTFSLYKQTTDGRQLITSIDPQVGAGYTLNDIRGVLDRGTFVWQVEALSMRGAVIEQRGNVGENTFILDFPLPGPVLLEDTGIFYGN
jgi:hypothetical protein